MDNIASTPLLGGTYEMRDGKRVLVEPPTADHPDGNQARPADDAPVRPGKALMVVKPSPQTEKKGGEK